MRKSSASQPVRCSVTRAVHNKDLKPGFSKSALAYDWQTFTGDARALFDHATTGGAFALGYFPTGYRADQDWQSGQLLGLDFDGKHGAPVSVETAASDPFISQHASFVYPTPSHTDEHPKTRVVFVLETAITDRAYFTAALEGLIQHCAALNPDPVCKDASRFFYGSDKPGALWIGRRLDTQTVEQLAAPILAERERARQEAEQKRQQARPISPATQDRAEHYARACVEGIIGKIAAARSNRYETTRDLAFAAFCKVGWPGIDSTYVTRAVEQAARANGFTEKHGESALKRLVDGAQRKAVSDPFDMPADRTSARQGRTKKKAEKPAPVIHPVELPKFTANLTINLPYVTQNFENVRRTLQKQKRYTLAIKSPPGTDKTGFGELWCKSLSPQRSALIITHRVALGKEIAQRFNFDYHDAFKGETAQFAKQNPRHVSTIDALWKIAGNTYDVIVWDEYSQGLLHLAGAGTLNERAVPIAEILTGLIRRAKFVLLTDAGMTDDDLEWIKAIRPNVYKIENTYRPERPPTTLLGTKSETIWAAIQQIKKGEGCVAIACASAGARVESTEGDAHLIYKYLLQNLPEKRGAIIWSRNSETLETQRFIANINEEVKNLDYVIYTMSAGTGMNGQTPIAATFGIFGIPINPADSRQMMGRFRHARQRTAYCPYGSEEGDLDAETILNEQLEGVRLTAQYGVCLPDESVKTLARLKARQDARHNREVARYQDYFAAYTESDGSTIQVGKVDVPGTFKTAWRQLQDAAKERLKMLTLDIVNIETISNKQMDELKQQKKEITEPIAAGNLRYNIKETAGGLEINKDMYERLRTTAQQRDFERFVSIISDETALKELDQKEGSDRLPLHRRKHWTAACNLFLRILKQGFGVDTIEGLKNAFKDIPKADLAQKVAFIATQHAQELRALLHYRPGHDSGLDNPVGLFRWLCKRFYIKWTSTRVFLRTVEKLDPETGTLKKSKEFGYEYSLDTAELDELLIYAKARRAADREKRIPKTSDIPLKLTNLESTTVPKQPPTPLLERPAYVAGRNPNPYSSLWAGANG